MSHSEYKKERRVNFDSLLNRKSIANYTLILSGLLSGCTFSGIIPSYLLPVLLIPFIYCLIFLSEIQTLKQHILSALLFYVAFHSSVYVWFLNANIHGLTGISEKTAIFASGFILCLTSLIITVPMLWVGIFIYLCKLNFNDRRVSIILLPIIWVVCEYFRSIVFSIYAYGKGGSIGDYWNFGSLGLSVMQSPLSKLSQFIGMYGLSFIVISLSVMLTSVIFYKSYRQLVLYGSIFILLIGLGYFTSHTQNNQTDLRWGSVQSSTAQNDNYFEENWIENENPNPKDLIVLTEYSELFNKGNGRTVQKFVNNRLSDNGISVDVDGGEKSQRYGTLRFRDSSGIVRESQTKKLLIPTGEYMPNVVSAIYAVIGKSKYVDNFNLTRKLSKGLAVKTHVSDKLVIGPVACSGILSRNDYRKLVNDGAEVLTNSASLVIFNQSKAYFEQSLSMARFHSIANQRTYIQASRGAPAFVLDNNGDYIVRPGNIDSKFTDFSFYKNNSKTLYTIFGEWILYCCIVVAILTIAYITVKYRVDKTQ